MFFLDLGLGMAKITPEMSKVSPELSIAITVDTYFLYVHKSLITFISIC